nr:hypothetical protein [Chromobacterium sp. ASV5]
MFATATPAPAAAHILIDRPRAAAANAACYTAGQLSAFRVHFQQPRTRIRTSLVVLARTMGEALDRVDSLLPGYVMSGWGRA